MTAEVRGIHPLDLSLREALYSSKRLRGVFNGLPSPAIVEMCAFAGFDFVVLDNEHGIADLQTTEHMLRAGRASGIPMAVRCLEQDIARTLDAGAAALKIPMVNSAAHAAALVQRIKYPLPPGQTGIAGQRGSAFSSRAARSRSSPGHSATSRSGLVWRRSRFTAVRSVALPGRAEMSSPGATR